MNKLTNLLFCTILFAFTACTQDNSIKRYKIAFTNVTGSFVQLNGEEVLKVERDLKALPFDINNLGPTVNGPLYARLENTDFENGTIEVKVLSRIQKNTPYPDSWGFIGLAFRINEDNTAFESMYLRPKVGRVSGAAKNEAIQYYSFPDYKMDNIGRTLGGPFQATADIGLDEWITMRIEVEGQKASLFINNKKEPALVINQMKGNLKSGDIGLWVDIGTEGYFKDLKITKR